jgi:hypothetical protein
MEEFVLYSDSQGRIVIEADRTCLYCEDRGERCLYCGTYCCGDCPHVCRISSEDEKERKTEYQLVYRDMVCFAGCYIFCLYKKSNITTLHYITTSTSNLSIVFMLVYDENKMSIIPLTAPALIPSISQTNGLFSIRSHSIALRYQHPSPRMIITLPIPLLPVISLKLVKRVPKCAVHIYRTMFSDIYIPGEYKTSTIRDMMQHRTIQILIPYLAKLNIKGWIEIEVKDNSVTLLGVRGTYTQSKRGRCTGLIMKGNTITSFSCTSTELLIEKAVVAETLEYIRVKRIDYLYLSFCLSSFSLYSYVISWYDTIPFPCERTE